MYVDEEEVVTAFVCGIPALSVGTRLALSVWNWKNFLTDSSASSRGIQLWQAAATFSNVTIPAPATFPCRYGNPFRGGGNPIVRYEAGIGSDSGLADVVDFKEVSQCMGFVQELFLSFLLQWVMGYTVDYGSFCVQKLWFMTET